MMLEVFLLIQNFPFLVVDIVDLCGGKLDKILRHAEHEGHDR